MTCTRMLSLKRSPNTLSTNIKMNLIYLFNVQYVKRSDSIKFVPYFNRQDHVKDKKNIFQIKHCVSYKYPIRIGHGTCIYAECRSIISYNRTGLHALRIKWNSR